MPAPIQKFHVKQFRTWYCYTCSKRHDADEASVVVAEQSFEVACCPEPATCSNTVAAHMHNQRNHAPLPVSI